jgi:hypothetical protein
MDWCEENGVDYVFALAGNDVLHAEVRSLADDHHFTIRPNSASYMTPPTSIAYCSQNRRFGRNRTVVMNRCG